MTTKKQAIADYIGAAIDGTPPGGIITTSSDLESLLGVKSPTTVKDGVALAREQGLPAELVRGEVRRAASDPKKDPAAARQRIAVYLAQYAEAVAVGETVAQRKAIEERFDASTATVNTAVRLARKNGVPVASDQGRIIRVALDSEEKTAAEKPTAHPAADSGPEPDQETPAAEKTTSSEKPEDELSVALAHFKEAAAELGHALVTTVESALRNLGLRR